MANGKNLMATSRQIGSGLPALSLGLALALAACGGGTKEVTVRFTDCPPAVQKAIIAYAEGVKFDEVERETQPDGKVDYQAKGRRAGGSKIEIKVSASGQLLEFKSEVDAR